jgi:hypothetical protein
MRLTQTGRQTDREEEEAQSDSREEAETDRQHNRVGKQNG